MSLSVSNLSFSYGRKEALKGVSCTLAPGFSALLGPNGAGKSTLFALLTRLFTAPGADIQIAGHDLNKAPRKALAALGVVFQQPTLDLDLTVRQNLKYFAALHGLRGADAAARIEAALERLDIADRAGEKVRKLNGGHRRRTEIARVLLHDPQVLLLDEPTVGLDAASRAAITHHVHALAEDGMTVLWATHLTDEIGEDDHLLILHQGAFIAEGRTGDVAGARSLKEHFLSVTGGDAP
ncbi:MAG: ABC transporter ATP-binding protein [Pseudomonadota bacterium]